MSDQRACPFAATLSIVVLSFFPQFFGLAFLCAQLCVAVLLAVPFVGTPLLWQGPLTSSRAGATKVVRLSFRSPYRVVASFHGFWVYPQGFGVVTRLTAALHQGEALSLEVLLYWGRCRGEAWFFGHWPSKRSHFGGVPLWGFSFGGVPFRPGVSCAEDDVWGGSIGGRIRGPKHGHGVLTTGQLVGGCAARELTAAFAGGVPGNVCRPCLRLRGAPLVCWCLFLALSVGLTFEGAWLGACASEVTVLAA